MIGSLDHLRLALVAVSDPFGDTHVVALVIALVLHTASLLVRARVWCGILRVALPGRAVPMWPTFWAYMAGVGANVLTPFRGGDLVRLYAARRVVPGAPTAVLAATLIAETVFGLVVIIGLSLFTAAAGWLPPLVKVPDADAFEFSLYARHPLLVLAVLVIIPLVGFLASRHAGRQVQGVCRDALRGVRVLGSPALFARVVALPQLADWMLRIGMAYALLAAFGVQPSIRAAILVVVIDSAATALPFTPGGAGAQQALLVLALGGTATAAALLSFSIGAQAVITAANLVGGVVAIFVIFGHVRVRQLAREARATAG
jgi:uncharacterized membrane protein YbhN (UPF0104 family)